MRKSCLVAIRVVLCEIMTPLLSPTVTDSVYLATRELLHPSFSRCTTCPVVIQFLVILYLSIIRDILTPYVAPDCLHCIMIAFPWGFSGRGLLLRGSSVDGPAWWVIYISLKSPSSRGRTYRRGPKTFYYGTIPSRASRVSTPSEDRKSVV